MQVSVKIEGLAEIGRALRELPKRVDRKVLDDGLLAGARLIRDDAKARAPELADVDSRWQRGALKRAIRATRVRPRQYTAEAIVSVRKLSSRTIGRLKRAGKGRRVGGRLRVPGDAYYWHFVEFGTAKMRARPFLRPAFEAQKQAAVDLAIKRFRERVQLEIEKLGRRF